jgi:GNAT superfamily N-acetyltransferase
MLEKMKTKRSTDLNLPEIISAIEQGLVESALAKNDSEIIREQKWYQVITPTFKHPQFNGVLFSCLDDHEADEKIKSTIQKYVSLSLPFRWEVGPNSMPTDLGQRLISAGMTLESEAIGMAAEPSKIRIKPNPEITVERIDISEADVWAKTSLIGWSLPSENLAALLEDVCRNLKDPEQRSHYFLARQGREPVGAAVLRLIRNVGYLHGSSVLPEYRKTGIYKELVRSRIQYLTKNKFPVATIHCLKDSSAPICKSLGFEAICNFQIYHLDNEKPLAKTENLNEYQANPTAPPPQNKLVLDDILRWESSPM